MVRHDNEMVKHNKLQATSTTIIYSSGLIKKIIHNLGLRWCNTLHCVIFGTVDYVNELSAVMLQVYVQPRHLGCQFVTARICCWAPCCGAIAVNRHQQPAQCSAANPPLLQSSDGTDGRTDTQPLHKNSAPHTMRAVPIKPPAMSIWRINVSVVFTGRHDNRRHSL